LLRLAGEVADVAEGAERFDEQPVRVELAGDLDRLFTKAPCGRNVNAASGGGCGDQRCRE
jgi:hypothetical protein